MHKQLISFQVTNCDKFFAKFWLGAIGITLILGALTFNFVLISICSVMLFIGIYYFNKTLWSVMDEVWDCGDHLEVIKGQKKRSISLNNILEVSSTYSNHKHLITIKTICSGKFGNSITFRATKGYPFFKHPRVLPELNQRIRNAKQES
tara:strand:- start:594 stop:1040 length:447 start_codon:yes stop_codon:yes gene_type:complete